jgi:predicted MPP superfamily phosphohydrolase
MVRARLLLVATAVAALAGVLLFARFVAPRRLEVTFHRVDRGRLADALAGLRLVAVADPHVDRFGAREENVLRRVADLAPDVLVWLGDYVQYGGEFGDALTMLGGARGRIATYGVLGDADYSNARGHCVLCHRLGEDAVRDDLPVRFLRDQAAVIENGGRRAAIVGLDPATVRRRGVPAVLSAAGGLPTLVLSHYPWALDDLADRPVDLLLAGDTHGGQVYVPWPLSRLAYRAVDREYLRGWFTRGGVPMYVSRGTGVSHVPVRLGSVPEIVVLDFGRRP